MHDFNWNPREYGIMVANLSMAEPISTDTWQAMDISGSKVHKMHELTDVSIVVPSLMAATTPEAAIRHFSPDQPWAHEHFAERVSGTPLNPAPSHVRWPYAVRANADHTDTRAQFHHTYPERMWPRHAGHPRSACPVIADMTDGTPGRNQAAWSCDYDDRRGIRFRYGDAQDVVDLMVRDRYTRQAFLPIWFPEDTGAGGGAIRVPCTLGYHFMIRGNQMSMRYYLRSCDVYRHLHNDLYFASMLQMWMCDRVNADAHSDFAPVVPGRMVTHIASLHAFVNDMPRVFSRMVNMHPKHGMAQYPATCTECRRETALSAPHIQVTGDVL